MNDTVPFYKCLLLVASRYNQKHKVGSYRDASYEVAICCMLFYYGPGIGLKSISPVSFIGTHILAEDPNDPLKVPRS